jgi:1,2-diacylglycerol-3-alpha-glucose alpha-1,2-galactosyltransferase
VGEKIRVSVISESQFTPAGHGVHTAFLEHVSYLTRCEGVQLDVNRRGNQVSDVIHVHTVGPYALLLLSTTRTVRIVTAHLLPESLMGSVVGAPWLQPLARRYFPWFYNRADIVIAVSDHVKEALLDLGVKKPIFVLGNSIDVESVANARTKRDVIRYRLGLGQKDFLVLSVGQLQPRKGILEFLRFAEQLPSVKFVWVGGPIFGVASAGKTELYRAIDSAPANFSYTGPQMFTFRCPPKKRLAPRCLRPRRLACHLCCRIFPPFIMSTKTRRNSAMKAMRSHLSQLLPAILKLEQCGEDAHKK